MTDPLLVCAKCGGHDRGGWDAKTRAELLAYGLCFNCNFWRGVKVEVDCGTTIIVNGDGYTPGSEGGGADAGFRGFGGARFRFRVGDGPERTSTNMWFRGPVPAVWRDSLPDNAVFVKSEA